MVSGDYLNTPFATELPTQRTEPILTGMVTDFEFLSVFYRRRGKTPRRANTIRQYIVQWYEHTSISTETFRRP